MLRFSILSLVLFLVPHFATHAAARTFTNTEGKALEAEIVSADATSVTLRRTSDQREFKLLLSVLSDSDRQHVTSWRAHLAHPRGWRRLRIHGGGQTIAASCLPIYGPIGDTPSSRHQTNATLELTLPLGAWIHLAIHDSDARVQGLVKFEGASDWYLSSRDNVLTVRKGAGSKARTIPAVVQYRTDAARTSFSKPQLDALRWGASLTTSDHDGASVALPRSDFPAARLQTASLAWSDLPTSLRALQLNSSDPVDLAGIERFASLEHLSISAPAVRNLQRLTVLPKLRALYLKSDEIRTTDYDYLGRLRDLRHLFFNAGEHSSRDNAHYSFLSSHTKLESLSMAYGPGYVATLDPALVKNCRNLTRLDFVPRGPTKDDYLLNFPELTDLSLARVDPEIALTLMESGHFKHLHTIRNASFSHPLTNLPKLRTLQLGSSSWPRTDPRWDQLPFLERVEFQCPTDEVLVKFSTHPAFQTVQHLALRPRRGLDLSPLAQLPALLSFRLESHPSTGALDLTPFPNLQFLDLFHCQFSSIPHVRNLRALKIDSTNLERLGDGSPTRLAALDIIGTKLFNLAGLAESPDLSSLSLSRCRELESHSGLADSRKLAYLLIDRCPALVVTASR